MQQQQLQLKKDSKINNQHAEALPISLSKDLIHHRPAPKKVFTMKQRVDNLEKYISKIKSPKDLVKNSKDSHTTNSKINSKVHNHEITSKADKAETNSKKSAKAKKEEKPTEKKKRGRRGKIKIKS